MSTHAALLILDAQVNMFAKDGPVFEGDELLQRISDLIAKARATRAPIIYVQNNGAQGDPDLPGTPGWEIHPAIAPRAPDTVLQKRTPDAFHETSLQSTLETHSIQQLVIAGMQTEMCIDATCHRARALSYDVILASDAHSTFDDGGLTAAQIIAQYNETLGTLVKVEEASRIAF